MSGSPRWLSHLREILSEHGDGIAYSLSTVDTDGNAPTPRVRHHLHRNILTMNPIRPLLITTSDVRAPKVHQLCTHPDKKGPNAEIAWWLSPARAQFRFSARTYVLPTPGHRLHSQFPTKALSHSGGRNADSDFPETAEDWEKFRVKTFNSLPAFLRASFVRPAPGTLLSNPNDAYKWPKELPESGNESSEEERKNVKVALNNFAVIVLEPLEVEFLEFAVEPNRRTQWKLSGNDWKESFVVP